ncbi:geranylgeranyl reductase family protein [Fertoebacter nigrum]|uniref:Geranylgeranyl reductase family protein n=1 Tax=Fertoeibacter niger TaxID=2656921 RepID=A0A8X8H5P6_9RHOB|nr:geranylgeranyl reductase family protein [Fertoeibacter niger]
MLDVIIIGAGPAGAAAAVTACRKGLTVALIDKARFPRDKLCGGGITGRSRAYIHEIFGATLPPGMALESRRVRIMAGTVVLGDLADAPPLHLTMRVDFDGWLHGLAIAAGAQDFTGQRIARIDPALPAVTLEDGRHLTARVLIGADGVNSITAKALHGRAYDPDRIGFAMEAEVPHDAPPADPVVEIDMAAVAWGYGWSFPKRGSVTLGVGGVHGRNPKMQARLADYLALHGQAADDLRCKGAFLPFGDARQPPGRGPVLLAGDAAGLVDPLTGEGIAWAMKSGQLAGRAAAAAIAAGHPGQAFARYDAALAPVAAEMRHARRLRALVYHPLLRGRFLRSLARQPGVQRRFLALLAGERDYADMRWSSFARQILRVITGGRALPRG